MEQAVNQLLGFEVVPLTTQWTDTWYMSMEWRFQIQSYVPYINEPVPFRGGGGEWGVLAYKGKVGGAALMGCFFTRNP